MPLTATGLEKLLRRSRPYGVRAVCFAGGEPSIAKLVDSLIEDGVVDASEREALLAVLKGHLVDIRGLPAEQVLVQISDGARTL